MYTMANKYYAVAYGGGTRISVPSRESERKKNALHVVAILICL